ncbi:MAG: hypothetical protein NZ869_11160 [Thermoanaerobaculum sp.]|nr:hypothetical protein [Thermoanaerobaculum sp.]MDW7967297.1 hypothetical protein [Thermoanaerobaculum sp.]
MNRSLALGALAEELEAEKLRQFHVRGFLVIDESALAVASTFHSPAFEEKLCAVGGAAMELLKNAQRNLDLSGQSYLWLSGVERTFVAIPLLPGFVLLAICEAGASPATALVPLLSFAQRLVVRVFSSASSAIVSRGSMKEGA